MVRDVLLSYYEEGVGWALSDVVWSHGYFSYLIPKTSEYRGQLLLIVYTEGNKVVRVDHLISRLMRWEGRSDCQKMILHNCTRRKINIFLPRYFQDFKGK